MGETLSSAIDRSGIGTHIDFLSLDVEGYELHVLQGLDLIRHRPTWILIETAALEHVLELLRMYEVVEQMSHHDYLLGLIGR